MFKKTLILLVLSDSTGKNSLLSHLGEKYVMMSYHSPFKSVGNMLAESKNMPAFLIYFNFYQSNTCT